MLVRLLVALLAAGTLAGCVSAPPPAALEGRVTRVVDGDTVHVRLTGSVHAETVRYIGIDTPETARSPRGAQCYGARATQANARLVSAEPLRLRPGRQRRDRYGRLLATVSRVRDGLDVSAELLRRGYARPLAIRPNLRRAEEYAGLARLARQQRRGLWSACASTR